MYLLSFFLYTLNQFVSGYSSFKYRRDKIYFYLQVLKLEKLK